MTGESKKGNRSRNIGNYIATCIKRNNSINGLSKFTAQIVFYMPLGQTGFMSNNLDFLFSLKFPNNVYNKEYSCTTYTL